MGRINQCVTCAWEDENGRIVDGSRTNVAWGKLIGVHESGVRKHRKEHADRSAADDDDDVRTIEVIRHRPVTLDDARDLVRASGDNPDDYRLGIRHIAYGHDQVSNRISLTPKTPREIGVPDWPVIQPAPAFIVPPITRTPKVSKWATAILGADTQVGYRILEDGTAIPFHDEDAIDVFLQIAEAENPDLLSLLGDVADLPSQSRWAQEAAFQKTMQRSIDRTGLLAAQTRQAAPNAKIVWIEGNHDKRLQNFVETNALSAFGLRRANMPEEWPVMSLQNLLRLDEYDIIYKDAYPAAHYWVNDKLRLEHGTKANAKGSTASQYMNETPHISRAHGHTHRLEAQSKTTYDRMGKIRSMAINPGCLCRVDGAVPSVHGAIGIDGKPAEVWEDWQQGMIVIRYREGDEFFVDGLVQIDEGRTVYQGQEFVAAER